MIKRSTYIASDENGYDHILVTVTEYPSGYTDAVHYTFAEAFRKFCGLDYSAAEFCAEWYPELISYAIDEFRYDMTFNVCSQMTESEAEEFFDYFGCTEDHYSENYGVVIRDAAFDGVVVMGQ